MTQENKPLQLWAYTGDDGFIRVTSLPINFNDDRKVYHLTEAYALEAEREKVRKLTDVIVDVLCSMKGYENYPDAVALSIRIEKKLKEIEET